MRKIILHIPLLILTFITFPVQAETQPPSLYGLAMHGTPKYDGETAKHLDYANPAAPQGGTLKQSVTGTFDTLNPFSIKGKSAAGLDPLYYDRLMVRVWDEPFTLYPMIASKIDIPEDRSSLTIHINPKARFHDGSPITADDTIFSFETMKESGRPNMRRIYRLVETVEKRDELTVHFKFGEGYDRETVMILAMMPILSQAWWTGRTFDKTTLEIPLSSGPYKIESVDPGRQIIFERVKDYWAAELFTAKGHFNFDRLVFDYYRDDSVAFEAFKSGEFDLRREGNAGKWATAYDFPAIKSGAITPEALPHSRPEKAKGLIFNTRRAPFDDIRVRKALSLALDFDWLNKNLFHSQYKRITSYFPNSVLADTNTPQPQAPLRSRLRDASALLDEAGWAVENGTRIKDGEAFSFEILLRSAQDEKIALAFIRNLERLGIKAYARIMDSAAYRGRMNEYDFDMTLYHWLNSLSPGTEQMLYWSCEAAHQPAQWNFAGICDPAIDTLTQNITNAKDYGDLTAQAHALDRALMAGHYMIPLSYAGRDFIAYRTHLHHPELIPLYGAVLETWWTEE